MLNLIIETSTQILVRGYRTTKYRDKSSVVTKVNWFNFILRYLFIFYFKKMNYNLFY